MSDMSYEGNKDIVKKIKYKGESKDELRRYLTETLGRAMEDREPILAKCKDWIQQANSRLKRKDARPRDANVDMPLTRERMMQNSARLQNAIFQQDQIFIAKARNPMAEDHARQIENLLDYTADQIDYMSLCDEWIEQFQTFPCGVVKTPFVTEMEKINRWIEIKDEEGAPDVEAYIEMKANGETVVLRNFDDGSEKYFLEVEREVVLKAGAFPEVVPFEDFIVPVNTQSVEKADVIFHRVWKTKSQIEYGVNKGVYNTKDGDDTVIDALGEPSGEREKLIDYDPEFIRQTADNAPNAHRYEIIEAYLSWDVDGDGLEEEIIVTFERNSGIFIKDVHNFYHAFKRPFVVHSYKGVIGSVYGVPMTFILEPLHRAYSASFAQRLDAASLANEIAYVVPPGSDFRKLADKDEFRGAIYEASVAKDEVVKMEFSQPYTQLPELEARLDAHADKISALSDYSWGNEQIDRPTATGQIQIIEESKQPQYMMLERFRASLALIAKHVLARYQQFYPEGLQFYIQQEDPQGVQLLEQIIATWPETSIEQNVLVETKVSSASMSKQLRKQEAVALVDKMPDLYQTMMQLATAAVTPGPMSMIAGKLLNGFNLAVDDMLTEFEVGKKEHLNPPLVSELQIAQGIQQKMGEMDQQIQTMGGQIQGLQGENFQLQTILAQVTGMGSAPGASPPVPGSNSVGGNPAGPQNFPPTQ